MRVLLLFAALLGGFLPARAQNQPAFPAGWKPVTIKAFGGLNLLSDSSMIDGDAQVAQNVLTDNTYLEKRPGNTRLATILAGYPVQYVGDWAAPNGSRYLIAQSSQTIYQTNFSGAPVALSTVAAGFNITVIPAFSKLEFSDGFRALWYWNDNSTGTVTDTTSGSVAPVCTYIAFKDSRIWCANLPNGFSTVGNTENGGGSSTVLISSSGGDGYWAVPANVALVDSVPNRFDFNPNDGDQITCLATTPWGMFIGKRNSSYIVKGNGNLSYDPRILDPKIGCVDNRSVQMVYGVLEWLAVDGVYGYDGSGPPRLLTRELDPLMQTIREATFSQGQWATQLYPDWASGTESTTTLNLPPLPWDYTTLPGKIFPSSGTLYDDNTSPQFQTCSTNLNPANGLPWSCGVGFSSDTLVNIDTTSFPLSIGLAQVAPSSGGAQVWISSFPAGNYTTLYTTWTASGIGLNTGIGGTGVIAANNTTQTGGTYLYTSAASSQPSPGTSGWNFGSWSFDWYPVDNGSGLSYGICAPGAIAASCIEYHFMANQSASASSGWSGYGVLVNTPSGGSPYTATLFKSVLGVRTTLGAPYTFNIPSSFPAVISTFTITRTPGGYMNVTVNGVSAISAFDNTSIAENAVYTEALLYGTALPAASQVGLNALYSTKLNGFGSGSILSRIYDIGQAAPLAGVLSSSYTLQGVTTGSKPETEIDFYVRASTSPNNDLWTAWQASSNSVLATLPERYWQYEALFTSRIASATAQLSSVELSAVTTGYYYSRVDFVGNLITSWRQFGVTEPAPDTYGYAVRQSTNPNDLSSPTAGTAWVAQTANQNVNLAVSTPTYAQFRLDSTPLISNPQGASAADAISAIFLRWNQGANIPVASDALERRYYLCVAISSTAAAPDTCLIRQKTGKWVNWSNGGTIGAMGLYNNQMVAADGGPSSNVWSIMQANVYEDDGSPINSQWVGGDEVDGLPFNMKTYYGALVDVQPVQASSVTYGYTVNKSSTFVTTTFSTDNGQALAPLANLPVLGSQYGNLTQWIEPPSGYDKGFFIRVQFSDDTLDNYFRVNDYEFFVHDEPWSPP